MARTKSVADSVEVARQRVQAAIRDQRIRPTDLARAAGLPKTTLGGITNPDWNPSSRTLSKLLMGLEALESVPPTDPNQ